MLLCAKYILPITAEPLQDGAVYVRDGIIRDLGRAELMKLRYPDEELKDLGMAVLMPGLIDLSTHIEHSVLRGIVGDEPYAQWLRSVRRTASRLELNDWASSATLGGLEALSSGITCIADVSVAGASHKAMQDLGLRGVVYRAVGAMDSHRVSSAINHAERDIDTWQQRVDADRIAVGIAPREVYECHPSVFTKAADLARRKKLPLTLSLAASREEAQFIRFGSSTFSVEGMSEERGFVEIPPWLPTGVTPIRYVLNWDAFETDNVMAVHCAHVDTDDIKKLVEYNVAVATCPRCNAQLSMGVAPVTEMIRSGLCVGLGTGYSVATDSTDLITEMRIGMLLQRAVHPGRFIDTATMLRMATIDAARALRMDDRIGSIEIGKCADLVGIDLSGSHQTPSDDPGSAVVNTCTGADVLLTMVDGKVKYEKNKWNVDIDVAKDIAHVIEIRGKLRN